MHPLIGTEACASLRTPESGEMQMADELLTSAKIAEQLGVSAGKVKKAIDSIALEPTAKKGICCLYDAAAAKKIKAALK